VTDTGPVYYGRQAIEQHWADQFRRFHFSNDVDEADQNSPHLIGTAGSEAWSNGRFTVTVKTQYGPSQYGPATQVEGYWLKIFRREGDTWKMQADAGFRKQ
jgi:ketosteroid isomerase-like protein